MFHYFFLKKLAGAYELGSQNAFLKFYILLFDQFLLFDQWMVHPLSLFSFDLRASPLGAPNLCSVAAKTDGFGGHRTVVRHPPKG